MHNAYYTKTTQEYLTVNGMQYIQKNKLVLVLSLVTTSDHTNTI